MANRKISDLTALTAPAAGDLLPIVDISEAAAADKNKKITYGTFLSSVPLGTAAAPSIAFTGDTNTGIYSPGADQLAIATGGTGRFLVTSLGRLCIGSASTDYKVDITPETAGGALRLRGGTTSSILQFTDSTASAQWGTIAATASTTEITHSSVVRVLTASSERARIDSSGRLLVGTSTSITTVIAAGLQVQSTGATAYASIGRWDNNAANPGLVLNKSRGGSVGTLGIVQVNDSLGELNFTGDDGSAFVSAARIQAQVDGTPGTNDMPGRLVFSTTADGASSLTERMRIKSTGIINFSNVPTYADNTAATAGGLSVGDVYKTVLGVLMIRY